MATDEDGALGLLWNQEERVARKARPALSLEAIARSAIEIADRDGIAAVSMQRVAGDLGFTKMSLYRYVANKAELMAVMIDTAVGEPPRLGRVPGGWRPKMEEFSRLLAETWERHPWLPSVTVGNRVMGPNEIGWIDSAVSALSETCLTGGERMATVFLLFAHIRNIHSTASAGTQPWTTEGSVAVTIGELMARHGARFPDLTRAMAETGDLLDDNGRRFGLDCIFNGIAGLIAQRERP
ncbi:TetR/AcrR family transcriptional regulator [Nonomuraea muscovyensis]|uniref:AcrR family transcriptional regulator n=1 Tax=Nonomuraea muscovyensis TaxID=1124761 RepID=A0A7X0C7G3_9ACTN|nr:TetR/AcrR family transcriptional regulator C-terminal domain-containing protein [Nonomuraea muscovyensis]MBB6349929.1 AcrR family transcriptional regulator [Nonomuraea muscovyensis]